MFEPCQVSQEDGCTLELNLAYDLVYQAMDSGSALDYWQASTAEQRIDNHLEIRTPPAFGADDDDSDNNADIREAKRRSRIDLKRKNNNPRLAMSMSPPKRKRSTPVHVSPMSPPDIRQHFSPTTTTFNSSSANRGLPIRPKVQSADIVDGDM
jgi:hypothetical protein